MNRRDRVLGALLGVALGDALGLPFEGLSPRRVARRFAAGARFRLFGRTGFVSDDTEQSALLAEALLAAAGDDDRCVRRFRGSMVGWLARLPFGLGWATLRACVRMTLGFPRPGVRSAGNGAAMRAGALGVCLAEDPARRRALGRRLASLTHTDPRAVDGALYVAELAAGCASAPSDVERAGLVKAAMEVVEDPALRSSIDAALDAAARRPLEAARLGNTGFVVHSVGLCTYCFLRFGDEPMSGIEAAIRAGGDTDTHAAIVGGWLGALLGAGALPMPLVRRIHDGPFGPTHLEGLARAVVEGTPAPRWSALHALVRNLALYPVILAHGLTRLWPW